MATLTQAKPSPALAAVPPRPGGSGRMFAAGFTLAWLALAAVAFVLARAEAGGGGLPIGQLSVLLLGAISPVALAWMVALSAERGAEIRAHATALEAHLARLTLPDEAGETRAKRLVAQLEAQVAALRQGGEAAERALALTGDALTRRLETLGGTAARAAGGIDEAAARLEGRARDLEGICGAALARSSDLEGRLAAATQAVAEADALARRAEALRETLSAQLETAATRLAGTLDEVEARGLRVAERLTEAAETERCLAARVGLITGAVAPARDGLAALSAELERAAARLAEAGRALGALGPTVSATRTEAERVLALADDRLERLAAAGTDLGAAAGLLSAASLEADALPTLAERLRAEAASLAEASQTGGRVLAERARLVAEAGLAGARAVATAQADLVRERERTAETAVEIARTLEGATAGFEARAETLLRAGAAARAEAERLAAVARGVGLEAAATEAKRLLDAFATLTADLAAALHGPPPAAVVRAFRAGDASVFLRRLVARGPGALPADKARQRIRGDLALAAAALRSAERFEDLLAQVQRIEGGAALAAALATSDLGRFYLLLCGLTDRRPVTLPGLRALAAGA